MRPGPRESWLGLIIARTVFNIACSVWTMRSFCREIPVDPEQAAMADGGAARHRRP
jgi:ABC-type glycerol-3-phosphate transport system permease component